MHMVEKSDTRAENLVRGACKVGHISRRMLDIQDNENEKKGLRATSA
jgi:hypothetical protein